jgi:two-component system phosphate regulon response regulator OmpR
MEDTHGRILLAGGNREVCALERHMGNAGFRVRRAGDAAFVDRLIRREHFDMLILDQRLPDTNGLELCGQLRQRGMDLPIVMLTDSESHLERVRCLDGGADDCVGRPFSAVEVIARSRAILRRLRSSPFGVVAQPPGALRFGSFLLDPSKRQLKKGHTTLPLSFGDFTLLAALARHPGTPMSRDQLMALISRRELRADDRSIDVRVARLRRLIERDASKPRLLQTVWGQGYMLVPEST